MLGRDGDSWATKAWRTRLAWFSLLLILVLTLNSVAVPQTARAQGSQISGWWLPYVRSGHSIICDGANNRLIAFGGWNGRQFFADVWALSLDSGSETWTQLDIEGVQPSARAQHSAIYDAAQGQMIVFGGHSRNQNLNDVWVLDLTPGAESWAALSPAGGPVPARRWHSAIYDAGRGQMVVLGGGGGGTVLGDLWALDLTPGAEAWSPLAPSGSPPSGRAQHSAIYDAAHQWMVVFGGWDASSLLDETWVLNLATQTWTQASPLGTQPAARRGHTAVYDGANSRMLIFGGLASGGFRNDVWSLSLGVPAAWALLAPTGTAPASRAWHTAALDAGNQRMVVIGGRGMGSLQGEAHWSLDLGAPAWSALTPAVDNPWLAGGGAAAAPLNGSGKPVVTLTVEDAPPDTVANVMHGTDTWLVAKIFTTSADYSYGVDVGFWVDEEKFDVRNVGTRLDDESPTVNWTTPGYDGDWYRYDDLTLYYQCDDSGCGYSRQIILETRVKSDAPQGYTYPTLRARGTNWQVSLWDTCTARVRLDPQAWVVANRAGLYDNYDPLQVQQLLDKVFEEAQGSGFNDNPTTAVLYADRHVPSLQNWDNGSVNYTNQTTANRVANDVDAWLDGLPHSPTYLVILGDDNLIPFYRKHEYEQRICSHIPGDTRCWENGEFPYCRSHDPLCDELVSNNFFKTDNPYGDVHGGNDWEDGDLEIAVGRLVGANAAEMQQFLESAVAGPNPDSDRAILASSMLDLWMPGEMNDPHDILKYSLGYQMNESLIDQNPTVTDVDVEMDLGFSVMVLSHHGEDHLWTAPGGGGENWSLGNLVSYYMHYYDEDELMKTNHPFCYFNACRMGYSYTVGWQPPDDFDDTMVWSLVHNKASGVVAAAGISSGCFNKNDSCDGDDLMLDYWNIVAAQPDRSDPLGWALMRAKDRFAIEDNYTHRKIVQIYTYFGLPWMRLPGHASTQVQSIVPLPSDETDVAWSRPNVRPSGGSLVPGALNTSFAITATVDASTHACAGYLTHPPSPNG